jgi:signal transduction histidine kinase
VDLLNYAKEREPEYQLCDPNRPALEVHDLMVSRAGELGVTLKMDPARNLPEAWFDPEGIHRVLLNLVTNAIDACTDISCASKTHEVTLRTLKLQGWAVEYQVSDNGCGMDEETKNKVFHIFFSTKGSRGTGLGLMIAKKIVDEHGGVIDLTSERGKGTIFMVRLPAKKQSA